MRKKFEILNDPKKKIILELPKFGGKIGAATFSITTLSMNNTHPNNVITFTNYNMECCYAVIMIPLG